MYVLRYISILDNIAVKGSKSSILETSKRSRASHFNIATIKEINF